jgi:cytochrome c553
MLPMQTKLLRIAFAAILAGLGAFQACAQSPHERMSTCFDCHGENGQSQHPEVPSLGAQPASYTLIELVMFRDQLRITEPMNEMSKGLSDDDLRAVSDIISKLPPPVPISDTADQSARRRARRQCLRRVSAMSPVRSSGLVEASVPCWP